MNCEIYVLGLLKFLDDKVVFSDTELEEINEAIQKELIGRKIFLEIRRNQAFESYHLAIDSLKKLYGLEIPLTKAIMHYYHHRVILYFKLRNIHSFKDLRSVRRQIMQLANDIIRGTIQESINTLVNKGKVNEAGKIEFFYTYPLILMSNAGKCEGNFLPFLTQISSLTFEIIEPALFKPTGNKLMVRISIPSTIICSKSKINQSTIRDVINAIYQHCLYEKKIIDVKRGDFENKLDESNLVKLWEHMLDTMGGRPIDISFAKLTHISYFLALIAIIISIISILLSLY